VPPTIAKELDALAAFRDTVPAALKRPAGRARAEPMRPVFVEKELAAMRAFRELITEGGQGRVLLWALQTYLPGSLPPPLFEQLWRMSTKP
jgi:hypothetical protein